MALRDKLSTIKTDQLDDLYAIMGDADKLEADLQTANNAISEKDAKIAELQTQATKLYERLILTDTGKPAEPEKESWEDMEGDEALDAFLKDKEGE